jgi:4,5-dihydroxyphthalate decarboxylase
MATGELAAGFQGNAGVGRSGSPASGWRTEEAHYPDLFPNAEKLEAEWHARTGLYPLHGTIVVKNSVLAEHPWVSKSIFTAFSRAKDEWLARLGTSAAANESDRKYSALRRIVGPDPLPYGIERNVTTIKALEETAFKQGLTPRRMSLDELFVDPEQ